MRAKFQRSIAHAMVVQRLFATALNDETLQASLQAYNPTGITYVPTHWLKRMSRGIDLPAMLARMTAKKLRIPLVHTLKKIKVQDAQSSLKSKGERTHSVKGIFALNKNAKPQERLLIIDDIITTGATFDEATRVLKSISEDLRCFAFAKTP